MSGTSLKRAFIIVACALHLPAVAYISSGDMYAFMAALIIATVLAVGFGVRTLSLDGRSATLRALAHATAAVAGSFVLAQVAGAFPPWPLNEGSVLALAGFSLLAYGWFALPASVAASVTAVVVGLVAWMVAPSLRVRPLTLQAPPVRLATAILADLIVFALLVSPWVGIGMYQAG